MLQARLLRVVVDLLTQRGIAHEVLNAKQHKREAEIVAQAGRDGAVTIATNMAGRGTDIKLEGRVVEAGGLAVIGTELHDAKRIDDQLLETSARTGEGVSTLRASLYALVEES